MIAPCWVDVPPGSDFAIANLPFGIATSPAWDEPHVVVAIGDHAVDLAAALDAGWFTTDEGLGRDDVVTHSLNSLMATRPGALDQLRDVIATRLRDHASADESLLVARDELQMLLPIEVADYVDFYSSEHHARNLGRILRPGEEPLAPNWKHLPVGYHGRAGSVVVSGTDVVRPTGILGVDGDRAELGPTRRLDIELEVATVIGIPSTPGRPVPVDAAEEHVAGFLLMNDWSARDIQAYEYRPLGPNLGKSFATTVSPWLVTLGAVAAFRVDGPVQDPEPPEHLKARAGRNIDLRLEVGIRTGAMRAGGEAPAVVARTRFGAMYWDVAQQLAHLTSNGASLRTGDLLGSGTVSGPDPGEHGSFIELSDGGARPVMLPGGEQRTFLEDGDEVVLRGWAGDGAGRVGFGTATGIVVPAGAH